MVEYEISSELYDIGFGVTAEREEGVTNVKESSRVDAHLEAVTGKFLVGSVPCALIFSFDNEYSWVSSFMTFFCCCICIFDKGWTLTLLFNLNCYSSVKRR